jgi:CheY-like chemotaxis protein
VAVAEAPKALLPGESETRLDQFRPSTILVFEDHLLNQSLLSAYFDGTGHRLLMAANGREGIDLARKEKPDIILMDIRMPEMDGWGASRILKNDPDLKGIPIIVITASTLADEAEQHREFFDAFLRKPISQADLVGVLGRFLPKSLAARDKAQSGEPETRLLKETKKSNSASKELISLLEEQLRDVWPGLCERPNMAQIKKFAARLADWAEAYGTESLGEFARSLHAHADRFDLEKLSPTLRRFPEIVGELSQS